MRLRALIFGSIIALAAHAQRVVLRGATVLEMTGASPRAADLVLEGERIAEVVPPGKGHGEQVIDLSGKFVLPGLADLHAHVLVHPTDEQGQLGPQVDRELSLLALRVLLAHGVTTVRDPGAATEAAVTYRSMLAAGKIEGPRLWTCGRILNVSTVDAEPFTPVRTVEDVRREVRWQALAGVDCVKAYAAVGPKLLGVALAEAHAHGLRVVGHLQATTWMEAAALGIDGLEHAAPWTRDLLLDPNGMAVGLFGRVEWLERLDTRAEPVRKLVAELARSRVPVDLTLIAMHTKLFGDSARWQRNPDLNLLPSTVIRGFRAGAFTRRWTKPQFARGHAAWPKLLAWVKALHEGGVLLTAGTDTPNPWIVPGASLHDELLLLEEAGIPRLAVLQMATRNAAIALGREREQGTVEAGKVADLLVLSADPLADLRNTRLIELVIQRGRLLKPTDILSQHGRP